MQNTKFVSTKYNNYHYAPGISLYGIDGKTGLSGENGTSLFICTYDITKADGRRKFGNAIRHGNTMTMEEPKPIGRNYVVGDSFLFPDGKIYSIRKGDSDDNYSQYLDIIISEGDNLTDTEFNKCMTYAGLIKIENQTTRFTEQNDRLVLDTKNYKGFVINNSDSENVGSIEAPLTIISSTKTGTNGIERYLDIKSIQTGMSDAQFRIYYDENNSTYVIDSDRPIRIDADFSVNNSSSSAVSGYSSISPVDTPITSFKGVCEHTQYTIGEGYVRYEYYMNPDNLPSANDTSKTKTSQIYTREPKEGFDITEITGGPVRTDRTGNVTQYDDNIDDMKFYRYKRQFETNGNDDLIEYGSYKKISVCIFRVPDSSKETKITGKPVFIQFTTTVVITDETTGTQKTIEKEINNPPVVIMNADGSFPSTTKVEKYKPKLNSSSAQNSTGTREYWKTDSFFIPSEADKFVVVVPNNLNCCVMVFGEGDQPHTIDEDKEEENRLNLEALFNGEGEIFPLNVLRTATAHYYQPFEVKFSPEEKQNVPMNVLPRYVHFKGIQNGSVEAEFYKKVDASVSGFDQTFLIDSYTDIRNEDVLLENGETHKAWEWYVSLIGISEIGITEEE